MPYRNTEARHARGPVAALLLLAGLAFSGLACPGSTGGGGGNDNTTPNANQNVNSNGNDNIAENSNDNAVENENDNLTINENDNLVENENDNVVENQNDNVPANENDNAADNENANDNTEPPPEGLSPETERSAFQSQCAQNVVACTTSFPDAAIGAEALEGQLITATSNGFRLEGSDGNGVELVQLIGSGSTLGDGATQLFFSWSSAASDSDPCSLHPGEQFASIADPDVFLESGFHYIRLTVRNDLEPIDMIDSATCGTFTNYPRLDFTEIEVEIVD